MLIVTSDLPNYTYMYMHMYNSLVPAQFHIIISG